MYFMSEFCFVCLGISKSLTDLRKSPLETKSTIEKLHSCVSEIEWSKSQQLLICEQCIIRLNIAYEFKKQCIRSHEAIQKCIQTQILYSGIQDQEIKDPVNKNTKIPIPNLTIKNGQLTSIAPVKIMPKNDVYPSYTNIIVANSQTKSFQNVFLNLIPTSMLNIASTTSSNISHSNNIVTTKPILQIPQLTSLKAKDKKKADEIKDVDVAKLLKEIKSEELSVEVDPLVFDTQENVAANQIDDWEDIISTQIVSQKNEITKEEKLNITTEPAYDDKMDFFNSGHFLFQDSADEKKILNSAHCETCGARFGDIKSLRTHIRVNHNGDFPHKCAFCSEEFAVKKHFDSHVRKHEMEQVLTLKDFPEGQDHSINKLAYSSDDAPLYECLPCERVFNTEQGLTLHNARRHKDVIKDKKTYFIKGKKSAQCDICQRMFSTHSYLIQHKKLHERGLQRRGRGPNKEQIEVEELMTRMGEQEEILSNLISKEESGNVSGVNSFAASFIEMIKNNSSLSAKSNNDQMKRSPYVAYSVPKKTSTPQQIPDVSPEMGDDYRDIRVECDVAVSDADGERESVSVEPEVSIMNDEYYNKPVFDEEYTPIKRVKKRKRGKDKSKKDPALTENVTIEAGGDLAPIAISKTKKKKVKPTSTMLQEAQSVQVEINLPVEQAISIAEPPPIKVVESAVNGAEIDTRSESEPAEESHATDNNHIDDEQLKKECDEDGDDQYKYVCVDGKPQCSFCKKLFGRKHDLRRHLNNVHLKSVHYVCHVCQKVFYEGFHLTRHLKTHFCYFHCGECTKMFVYVIPDFKNHVTHVHQSGAGAVCGICQINLPRDDLEALKSHMEIHFRAIVYTCHLCTSEFRDCRDLSKHLAEQHTGPIRCVTCRKTFQTEEERDRHQARRHHGIQATKKVERARIKCEFCTNTYLKRRYLRQHQKNVHGKESSQTATIVPEESVNKCVSSKIVSESRNESEPIDLSAKGAS